MTTYRRRTEISDVCSEVTQIDINNNNNTNSSNKLYDYIQETY